MRIAVLIGVAMIPAFLAGWWVGKQRMEPVLSDKEQYVQVGSSPQSPIPAVSRPQSQMKEAIKLSGRQASDHSEFQLYWQTYQTAAGLSAQTLQDELTVLATNTDEHYRQGISRIYFSRLVSLDGALAFQLALRLYGERMEDFEVLQNVLHEWVLIAPEAAVASLAQLDDKPIKHWLISSVIHDPAAASLLDKESLLPMLPSSMRQGMLVRLKQDLPPEQSFEHFLSGNYSTNEREAGLMNALLQWGRQDPQAALDKIITSLPANRQRNYLNLVLRQWAETDANSALNQALVLEKGDGDLIATVLQAVAERDGLAAMTQFQQHRNRMQPHAVQGILATWATHDLDGTLSYVEQNSAWIDKTQLTPMLSNFAQQRPIDAALWVSNANLPQAVIRNVAGQLVYAHPDDAEALLEYSLDGNLRNSLIDSLANEKLAMGFAEASAWVQSKLPPQQWTEKRRELLSNLAHQNPAEAADYVFEQVPVDEHLVASVAMNWASRDTQSARQWVQSLPSGPAKNMAISGYMRNLNPSQINDAYFLLEQISDDAVRQRLQNHLTQQLNQGQ
ncbi:hypothetical protein GCM10009092_43230 [Bowmanella denitrificans]|uniref:Uncharacterized protein n=1 Tax=Bowmanella denitrificans TaxID=366582 RepID=A0ABN0XVY7_9ALTE